MTVSLKLSFYSKRSSFLTDKSAFLVIATRSREKRVVFGFSLSNYFTFLSRLSKGESLIFFVLKLNSKIFWLVLVWTWIIGIPFGEVIFFSIAKRRSSFGPKKTWIYIIAELITVRFFDRRKKPFLFWKRP